MNCPKCKKQLKQETFGIHCTNPNCELFGQVKPDAEAFDEAPPAPKGKKGEQSVEKRLARLEKVVQALMAEREDLS